MSSRTTKQAARAYQKAHGVPYAEALRRVMQEEAFSSVAPGSETDPGELVVGEAGMGKTIPLKPVHLDPSQAGRVCLGTGKMPHTGLSPTTAELWWYPWHDMDQHHAATLGVYGKGGTGKTCYLVSLVHQNFHAKKTLVVTPLPQNYAELEDAEFIDPDLVRSAVHSAGATDEESQETMRRFDEAIDAALNRGVEVIIYDEGPQSRLIRLSQLSRSKRLVVLFTSLDVLTPMTWELPHGKVVPSDQAVPATVTVVLDSIPSSPLEGGDDRSWVCRTGHKNEPVPLLRPGFPTELLPGRQDAT